MVLEASSGNQQFYQEIRKYSPVSPPQGNDGGTGGGGPGPQGDVTGGGGGGLKQVLKELLLVQELLVEMVEMV